MALSEDLTSVEIDEALANENDYLVMRAGWALLDVLSSHRSVPKNIKEVMKRLKDKGERESWFVLQVIPAHDWLAVYQQDRENGDRILGIDRSFGRLASNDFEVNEFNFGRVREAIGGYVYEACLCADGHDNWAENRKNEFLNAINDESSVCLLAEAVRAQFISA